VSTWVFRHLYDLRFGFERLSKIGAYRGQRRSAIVTTYILAMPFREINVDRSFSVENASKLVDARP